jgi:uncharacterized cupin superfamily protein
MLSLKTRKTTQISKEEAMKYRALLSTMAIWALIGCHHAGQPTTTADDEFIMLNDGDIGLAPYQAEYITLENGDIFYIRTNCTGVDDNGNIQCDVYYPLGTAIVPGSCEWTTNKCRAYAGEDQQANEACDGYIECRVK